MAMNPIAPTDVSPTLDWVPPIQIPESERSKFFWESFANQRHVETLCLATLGAVFSGSALIFAAGGLVFRPGSISEAKEMFRYIGLPLILLMGFLYWTARHLSWRAHRYLRIRFLVYQKAGAYKLRNFDQDVIFYHNVWRTTPPTMWIFSFSRFCGMSLSAISISVWMSVMEGHWPDLGPMKQRVQAIWPF